MLLVHFPANVLHWNPTGLSTQLSLRRLFKEFPGGLVVRAPCFYCSTISKRLKITSTSAWGQPNHPGLCYAGLRVRYLSISVDNSLGILLCIVTATICIQNFVKKKTFLYVSVCKEFNHKDTWRCDSPGYGQGGMVGELGHGSWREILILYTLLYLLKVSTMNVF